MAGPDFLPENFGSVGRLGWEEVWAPAPVSYRPQTIGWAILALLVLGAMLFWARRVYRRRKANRYRKRALAEIGILRQRTAEDPTNVAALPVLLKRTALAGFPRRRVASLSGDAWVDFLNGTYENAFDDAAKVLLVRLSYRGVQQMTPEDIDILFDATARWVRGHRASV